MKNKSYISTLEQKLLVWFFIFISLLFYFHLGITQIEIYNENVKNEQSDLTFKANTPPEKRINFAVDAGYPPIITRIFWVNFLFIPFIIFLLRKRRMSLFIYSTLINILTTTSIIYWNIDNYLSHLMNKTYYFSRSDYGYFGVLSNTTALILAIAATIFVIIQLAIITRFVFTKNHAKISPR